MPDAEGLVIKRVLMAMDMKSRDKFFTAIRRSLGRHVEATPEIEHMGPVSAADLGTAEERADSVLREAEEKADELLDELEESATKIGWNVARFALHEEASRHIARLVHDLKAKMVVRSAHAVLDSLRLEDNLSGMGVKLVVLTIDQDGGDPEGQREALREQAIRADVGVTGADYAIAETGSCAIAAREGVSRLASLLPPVHVAVVRRGQVLRGLDELFALHRRDYFSGAGASYVNIISGPSRSGDIEQTLVQGVHGPGQVHLVLLE